MTFSVQTGTPGRQAHPLRKVSLLGAAKKAQDAKRDQEVARAINIAESSGAQPAGLTGSATDNEACFNMVNFILGAGVLGYPFCYKACGLVLTTLLVIICLVAAQLSMWLLLMSSQLSGKKTYEELARLCFGKAGQRVMGTCVFMLNLGALVAYVNILADVLSSVAGSIIPPGAEPSRNIVMTGESSNSGSCWQLSFQVHVTLSATLKGICCTLHRTLPAHAVKALPSCSFEPLTSSTSGGRPAVYCPETLLRDPLQSQDRNCDVFCADASPSSMSCSIDHRVLLCCAAPCLLQCLWQV